MGKAFDPFRPQVYRGGRYEELTGVETRPVIDPATVEEVGRIALVSDGLANEVAREVRGAQKAWARLDQKTRAGYLHRIADSIENSDFHDVALQMTREHGKPYPESTGELANCAPVFRYYAEMARDSDGHVAGTTQAGSFQFSRYFPYGVSVHITPRNFPVIIMCWTVAASLAAGNGCIVKPSESTSLCTLRFMEHFSGLPEGLVACLTGDGATAAALVASPDTHVVAFTGGVETGRRVAVACAERMKPCVIEAGGSDPMIISEHAPLDAAVAGSVTSAFHLSGQICVSSERFFVHENIHDEFVSRFAEMTRKLRIGNGLEAAEIGPLVSEAARDKVAGMVEDAVTGGATVVCGGRVPPSRNTGWFYEPTILTGVTGEMRVMREETFGPVASICKVASFEEALERANDSEFGLGASVFTSRLDEAMQAYEALDAGMVWVNNPLIDNDVLAFGGWKNSGLGRELGRPGLDAFRQHKMGVMDTDPRIQEWWYPYPDDWFYDGSGRTYG